MPAPLPFREVTGEVAAFDEARGLGTVRVDGGDEVPFHCTAIADGSRAIDEGARVRFSVVPGRLGRWEATHIAPA
ncbi:MAG TPA: cold shock domain-containing protein [Acidimicrobiales bacterium]|nr:cold shock domain-containing protein [Acidimicrobiales bacterium]